MIWGYMSGLVGPLGTCRMHAALRRSPPTPSYPHRSPPASYCHRTCPPSCYIPHTLATHPLLFGVLIMITQCPALSHQPRSTSLGMWDGQSHALPPQWVQKLAMKTSLVFWLPPDNSTSELIRLAEILGSTFGTKKWGLNHSKTALYRCYLISHHKNSETWSSLSTLK